MPWPGRQIGRALTRWHMQGLGTLKKLDVLDLHNNLIDSMEV